ncbi:exopolysaccharide biosynthesis protein [Rhizobium sp. TRM95111]|uniref:exopolysaccharide biosynthesis protein n=1 Tax=Rhizobium alarense TaxID=2846851 RepID=UPI001F38FBF1|nr:exopolysaccharide biosynthesis protein [Rhizobium alarense]MCF3641837.1 exopolysaccharide biosynthesis protein [Rhizobium alarense]
MESIEFQDTEQSTSQTLRRVLQGLKSETVTLRELIVAMGEQGLLLLCVFLCLPFLFPVSIPGVSTVFGAGIVLISLAITVNRMPWLPAAIADRAISAEKLRPTLERGISLVAGMERYVRPRLSLLVHGAAVNRFNGFAMLMGGVLLMAPLGLIPFSNTLPALAVLLLAGGIAQRDGLFVAGGYAMLVATVVYFGVLALLAVMAGRSLL